MLLQRNGVFRLQLGGREELLRSKPDGGPAKAEIMQRFAKIPVQITAGTHEIAITFVERARAATEDHIFGFQPYGGFSYNGKLRVPKILGAVQIEGPFGATGLSRTASRDKIFVCTPESPADERPCAERLAKTLATRAFRRPAEADDVERLMPFY